MHRRIIMGIVFAVLAMPAFATDDTAPTRLTADEITQLLSGNTIAGTWSGSGYSQFFAEGGLTVYIPANGRTEQGRWRVNAGSDQYESLWTGGSWTGYSIAKTAEGYGWVRGAGVEPFTVKPGKTISW